MTKPCKYEVCDNGKTHEALAVRPDDRAFPTGLILRNCISPRYFIPNFDWEHDSDAFFKEEYYLRNLFL